MAQLLSGSSDKISPVLLSEGVSVADVAAGIPYIQLPSTAHLRESLRHAPDTAALLFDASVAMVTAALTAIRPRVIVHDTFVWPPLLHAARLMGMRQVLSLRPRRDFAEYLAGQRCPVRDMDLVFVPDRVEHHPQFGAALRAAGISPIWAGPLYRLPQSEIPALRSSIGVTPHQKLITVTSGGGSGQDSGQFFTQVISALHKFSDLDCVVAVVLGPLSRIALDVPATFPHDLRVWRAAPDMPSLLAASDLIVCRGGYGTIHEAVSTGAPVLAQPAERVVDDQVSRLLAHQAEGRCEIFGPTATQRSVAGQIEELLQRPRQDPVTTTDTFAYARLARQIVDLALAQPAPGSLHSLAEMHM